MGGLPALSHVLAHLPSAFPASIVVVQHRSNREDDLLPKILAQRSRLPVKAVADGDVLRRGAVYVAPVSPQVEVVEGPLLVLSPAAAGPVVPGRCMADPLFASAAGQLRERAIGVVLTGRLRDGAEGVRAIKGAGGMVLVQDPEGCEAPEQPLAAIATGCVDFILPVDKIADALVCLTMVPGAARFFKVPTASWAHLPPPRYAQAVGR